MSLVFALRNGRIVDHSEALSDKHEPFRAPRVFPLFGSICPGNDRWGQNAVIAGQ